MSKLPIDDNFPYQGDPLLDRDCVLLDGSCKCLKPFEGCKYIEERKEIEIMAKGHHNYAKETAYEDSPAQVQRREARNKARRRAAAKGLVHKGDDKEVDHLGSHRTGSLDRVPTAVVSKHANRIRQPKRS